MTQQKILFIDRDGTLIKEPADFQIDSIDKLNFLPDVIVSLKLLKDAGFIFVMITNQDGLGTDSFPMQSFLEAHNLMLKIFESQGITFESILICPHKSEEQCECRKPKLKLVERYLVDQIIDRDHSYVIGDRETDMQLADNMGISGLKIDLDDNFAWQAITKKILTKSRCSEISRKTNETDINIILNLDAQDCIKINTEINFFNHMLEQLAKHAGIEIILSARGDIHIDDHHLIEDVGIVLGEAFRKALGDKRGIARYGFLLPMDESLAQVALDLSGRAYFKFSGQFNREKVGDLSTELVPHFFRSFAEGLKANLHIMVTGENEHHMIESIFKCVGRALRQAIAKIDSVIPTTKGIL